jgi:hypothetical protein
MEGTMFTFPILAVRKVIERGIADAKANGGFRLPHGDFSSTEQARPGLWLVGDQGVYIMANGKLPEGGKPFVVYSEQCHPNGDIDWWDYKRRHFGGDDGVEFIAAEQLIPLFDRNLRATHINMDLTEDEIVFSLITR